MKNHSKEKYSRYLLWGPALIALTLYLWSAFHADLSRREAREGVPVVNMFKEESIWLPKISDHRYRTKPPMYYWAGLLSSHAMGKVNEISLRLPSVIAGAGTVFLTTLLGFWIFSPITGAIAGLITTTSLQFSFLSSHARIDMLFVFFITLAFVAFWRMIHDNDAKVINRAAWLAAVALGFAFLTKGPLGLLFPLLFLFLYSIIKKAKIPWIRLIWVPLAMTSLWLVEGSIEGGKEFTAMIYRESVGRITDDPSIAYHNEPFYYYFIRTATGLFPWSFFLPIILWQGLKYHRKDFRWIYPAVAFAILFFFLSMIPGKREDYLVPAFPMVALLIAHGISVSKDEGNPLSMGWKATVWVVIVFLAVLGVIFPLAALKPDALAFFYNMDFVHRNDRWLAKHLVQDHFPSGIVLTMAGIGLLLFAGVIHRALKKNSVVKAWAGMAVLTVLALLFIRGPAARTANIYFSLKPFAQKVHQMVGSHPLIIFGDVSEDLLFYVNRPSQEETGGREVKMLHENPETYLIIPISQSAGTLAANPSFKVLLETDSKVKTHYQLIKNFPPLSTK